MLCTANWDRTFNIALFMRFETFSSLKTEDDAVEFFKKHFPDALALVGEYVYCVCSFIEICWAISNKKCRRYYKCLWIILKEKPSVFFSHMVSLSNGYNKGNVWCIWPIWSDLFIVVSFLNQFSNLGLGFFQCSPYHIEGKALIMGDAAHAMLPFLAQGVNSVRHVLHCINSM